MGRDRPGAVSRAAAPAEAGRIEPGPTARAGGFAQPGLELQRTLTGDSDLAAWSGSRAGNSAE
jgi:hypothetical protein